MVCLLSTVLIAGNTKVNTRDKYFCLSTYSLACLLSV